MSTIIEMVFMKLDNREIIEAGILPEHHIDKKIYTEFAWNIIDVCNFKCTYCGAGFGNDASRPVSRFFKDDNLIKTWKGVITKLKLANQENDFEVDLVGGEPTLHPDILEVLSELNQIKTCKSIILITNLSKPISFFHDIDKLGLNKLEINCSVHFEYYKKNKTLEKILQIKNDTSVRIEPVVLLPDDKQYWEQVVNFLETCITNDIEYNCVFLEPAFGNEPEYCDDFYETFDKYINHGRSKTGERYRVVTDDQTEHKITIKDIYVNKIKSFKGWKCTPKSWSIDVNGSITNSCTGEPLQLQGSNMNKCVACPRTKCSCNVWWNYHKYNADR